MSAVILGRAGHRRRVAAAGACLAVTAAVVAGSAVGARAAAPPSTPRSWVRSTRSVPTLPSGARALRAVAPATVVRGDVVLKPRDQAGLDAFDTAVSTPGTPSFRHYLAPGEFARAFGPRPSTISSVRAWLEGRGLSVGPTSGDGLIVPVSGTAAQVDEAFSVGLEQYRLPSGRIVRAPDAEPLVPSALAGDLYGVTGLDDLSRPVPQLVRSAVAVPLTGHSATGQTGAGAGVAPRAAGPTPTAGCENTIQSDGSSAARSPSTNWHRRTRSRASIRATKAPA